MLGFSGARRLWMLKAIAAALCLTELCSFCNCARRPRRTRQPSQPDQPAWQTFQAVLSDVAADSISDSQHMQTDLQPLALKVAVDAQAAADTVTERQGRKFRVKCMVLIWEAGKLPAAVVQGPAFVPTLGGVSNEITDGMLPTIDCQDPTRYMPPSNIGSMGWPCFRGGGTPVTATIEQSGRVVDGMVFYRPESARGYHKLDYRQRHPRYKAAADHCIAQEEAEEVMNVSRFAACIRNNYPEERQNGRKKNYSLLRANVAFTNYKRNGVDRAAGFASPNGGVWIDCTADEPKEGASVAPVSLCHAALFSCVEFSCYDHLG